MDQSAQARRVESPKKIAMHTVGLHDKKES